MSASGNIIVLDRDGVINVDSDDYIKSEQEWIALPGSIEAIATLCAAGFSVAVATNQSGIARGLFDTYELARMHSKMQLLVEEAGGCIATVCYCPHAPDADCRCRKPGTGLLEQIQAETGLSLKGCAFVGDSLKDLQAAIAFDMNPVLVRTGKGKATEEKLGQLPVDVPVFDSLSDYVGQLVSTPINGD